MARPKKVNIVTQVAIASPETVPPTRNDVGEFLPGVSGNPNGRPPATAEDTIDALQRKVEQAVRGRIDTNRVVTVVNKLLSFAEKGDVKAAGILLPYFLTKPSADSGKGGGGGGQIIIKVENATIAAKANDTASTMDAEFTEVKKDG